MKERVLDFVLRQEGADFFHEAGPSGFVLEDEMVLAFERHEARIRDHGRHATAIVKVDDPVVPAMQHKRRRGDLAKKAGDISIAANLAEPDRVFR